MCLQLTHSRFGCVSHFQSFSLNSHKRDEVKLAEEETTAAEGKTKTVAVEVPAALIDTSKAIKAALEASKTHGKASVEARMAWEAVEEMDAINARRRASVN